MKNNRLNFLTSNILITALMSFILIQTASSAVLAQSKPDHSKVNLTGYWKGADKGFYFIGQSKSVNMDGHPDIRWFAHTETRDKDKKYQWTNVGFGHYDRKKGKIFVDWGDIPVGINRGPMYKAEFEVKLTNGKPEKMTGGNVGGGELQKIPDILLHNDYKKFFHHEHTKIDNSNPSGDGPLSGEWYWFAGVNSTDTTIRKALGSISFVSKEASKPGSMYAGLWYGRLYIRHFGNDNRILAVMTISYSSSIYYQRTIVGIGTYNSSNKTANLKWGNVPLSHPSQSVQTWNSSLQYGVGNKMKFLKSEIASNYAGLLLENYKGSSYEPYVIFVKGPHPQTATIK